MTTTCTRWCRTPLAALVAAAAVLSCPDASVAQPRPEPPSASDSDEIYGDEEPQPEPKPKGEEGADQTPTEPAEPAKPPADPTTAEARRLFHQGASLVREARWSEALAAFERSSRTRAHAVTTYNIGACLRAMGRYVQARKRFHAALAQHDKAGGTQLSEALLEETRGFIAQIDGLLARLSVKLAPASAAITIDGRPLETHRRDGKRPVLLGGTLPPGPGKRPPSGTFDVLVDPGAHVITLSRKGFRDTVVNRTFAPGSTTKLDLRIDKLPATLAVAANREQAVVKVDGKDVGYAPVEVSRPGGEYQVLVEKDGYAPYETTASVDPGEHLRIRATLPEEDPALYEQWWFWSGVVAVVAGAVVITYFATRPEPERPEAHGGGLGWVVEIP